ncbi:MAG: methionine--tRNA ligase [Thaumarchaeota archaeon]|nr:methionine--tRNA ligase [Nitrososphaerota archaeon]
MEPHSRAHGSEVQAQGTSSQRRVIITAALPYANNDLHLGHIASTYLPPDILYRYLKHGKAEVIMICASDDFGTPILIAAEKAAKKPEEYVAYWRERFQQDLSGLGIDFDLFYATSSEENVALTQHFFKELYKNGYIYSSQIDQFYCNVDKKFLPDRYVKGACPYCGALDQYSDGCENCGRTLQPGQILQPKCSICGTPPVKKTSMHYFFKLSSFSDQLKKWLEANEDLQSDARNYVLNWIKEGLQDWDITRDISWGVKIPLEEAEGKVLYGWFDNHLCYISTALKVAGKHGKAGADYWNGATTYHFIGKDIVYHHYLFLPSMRLGEGSFKLPDFIPTRGHLLLQDKKISKSRKWGITIREYLAALPPDYLRFYLTRITPFAQTDSNFDLQEFRAKVNNELVANLGNFCYRSLVFVNREYALTVPEPGEAGVAEKTLLAAVQKAVEETSQLIESGNYDRALKALLDFGTSCNQYFQAKAPWEKRGDMNTAIYYAVNSVATLAMLLHPFLPFSSEDLWAQLSVGQPLSTVAWDAAGSMMLKPGHKIKEPKPLFKRVEETDLEALQKYVEQKK